MIEFGLLIHDVVTLEMVMIEQKWGVPTELMALLKFEFNQKV